MVRIVAWILLVPVFGLLFGTVPTPAQTGDTERWLQRWNREPGRETRLSPSEVLFKPSPRDASFEPFIAVGFRQSHGTYPFGRLIVGEEVYSPLEGLGRLLAGAGFAQLEEGPRVELVLEALQGTYGALGASPYRGVAASTSNRSHSKTDRPGPPRSEFSVDGTLRLTVWLVEEPGFRNGPEWRQVLYLVSADGTEVRARTLFSARPIDDRLPGFPESW